MSHRDKQDYLVQVFTDGAFSKKHNFAVWAFVVNISGQWHYQDSGLVTPSYQQTTQTAELWGMGMALKWVRDNVESQPVKIVTDSQYVQRGLTSWVDLWRHTGWISTGDKPVSHREVWERLDVLYRSIRPDPYIKWIKGHQKQGDVYSIEIEGNDLADKLAADRKRREVARLDLTAIATPAPKT